MDERRELIFILYGGICQFCGKPLGAYWHKHHGGKHDTDGNNQNYPLYTQSLMNLYPGHEHCHLNNPGFGKVSDSVADAWEVLLAAFKHLVKSGEKIKLSLLMKELELLMRGK